HKRFSRDWSSDVCSSDLTRTARAAQPRAARAAGAPPSGGAPDPLESKGRRGGGTASEGSERFVPAVRDVEQRVQLGQLEQRPQVVVEAGQAQLAALLADLLGQADEHAEAGGIDVARPGEVDQELACAALELLEHLLLQFLAIADDELALDVDRDDVGLFPHLEVHGSLMRS